MISFIVKYCSLFTATGIPQGNESCLNVRAQLLHDISKTAGQHNLYHSVSLLLPSYCRCFEGIKRKCKI